MHKFTRAWIFLSVYLGNRFPNISWICSGTCPTNSRTFLQRVSEMSRNGLGNVPENSWYSRSPAIKSGRKVAGGSNTKETIWEITQKNKDKLRSPGALGQTCATLSVCSGGMLGDGTDGPRRTSRDGRTDKNSFEKPAVSLFFLVFH